jgi:uncharacterized Zn-binding protein involved in type VI secretion
MSEGVKGTPDAKLWEIGGIGCALEGHAMAHGAVVVLRV